MPTDNIIQPDKKSSKQLLLVLIGLLALSATLVAGGLLRHSFGDRDPGEHSFSVSDSPSAFTITTYYDPAKTQQVQELVQNSLQRYIILEFKGVHVNTHMINTSVPIAIAVKTSPGRLKLELDKQESSNEVYMACQELKKEIAEVVGY
jgi:hypothetical protein